MVDPTQFYRDYARIQKHLTEVTENIEGTLEHARRSLPSLQWIQDQHLYLNRQFREWEDAIRHGRARTQERNQKIERFLKLTPTCPGGNCNGRLQKTETSGNERVKAVIGPQYDVKCDTCKRIIYLPPVLYFTRNAREYFRAARILRENQAQSDVASVTIFLLHQGAELYLKGLGACSLYDDLETNDDAEYIEGASLGYTRHNLSGLLQRVYPSLRDELQEYENRQPDGETLENLINAIPSQTAEIFRYGGLLRGQYGQVTFIDGDVLVEGKNISKALLGLCTRLENFTRLRVLP